MKLVFESVDEMIGFLKEQGYTVTKNTITTPICPNYPYTPYPMPTTPYPITVTTTDSPDVKTPKIKC